MSVASANFRTLQKSTRKSRHDMSVAFTREESAETAAEVELPDRPISPHPNLVTPHGLTLLQKAMAAARAAYEAAQQIEGVNERRRESAPAARDIRYLAARLHSAQVVPPSATNNLVTFGSRVTFTRDDGRRQVFRIVGEDEADPASGTISYVSPVARALNGKSIGDVATIGPNEIELLAIEQ
jgi:transcription elongation GreA/GreB family factor